MILWAVVLIGFLSLTAFVIAMGRLSTNRYEREVRSKARSAATAGTKPARVARAART